MMQQGEYQSSESASPGCRTFDQVVGAYLEGEDRPGVTAHAGECVSCRTLLGELQQVIAASSQLEDAEPPSRLWANLRVTLVSEGVIRQQPSLWQRWVNAIAFLRRPAPVTALACLGLLSLSLVAPSRVPDSSSQALQVSKASASLPSVDSNLQQTVQELQANYQAREVSFRPEVKAAYQRSLKSLDTSIEECRDSVEHQPGNTLAHEYLLAAYQQKAEVLQSALESEDEGR
jgi:hypothetical protein